MNMDEILTLVQAVSDSKLTSFKLDQGDMHISLMKEKEEAKIITVGAPGAVAAVPASSAAPVVTAASAGVSTEAPAAAPEAAESHDISLIPINMVVALLFSLGTNVLPEPFLFGKVPGGHLI